MTVLQKMANLLVFASDSRGMRLDKYIAKVQSFKLLKIPSENIYAVVYPGVTLGK